jgi:sterol carrier protein 2
VQVRVTPCCENLYVAVIARISSLILSELLTFHYSHCYCGTTAGQAVLAKLGLPGVPVYNTNNNCSSGSSALHLAHALVSSGQRAAVLVLGFEQMERGLTETFPNKPSPTQEQTNAIRSLGIATDPLPGLNALTSDVIRVFAEAANDYCNSHGVSPRIFAEIAVKNRQHGMATEYSSLRGRAPPSVEDTASQRMLYEPITGFMSAPTADGAAAAIVVSLPFLISMQSLLASITSSSPVVELLAISMRCDGPSSLSTAAGICGYDLAHAAAADVFNCCGGATTIKNVDVIELHDCFATAELHLYDSLGLSPVGGAARLWASRRSRPAAVSGGISHTVLMGENGGEWVVNPSGGLESKGHPIGATGVAQCYELWLQLQGRAGLRQVLKQGALLPSCALQHNFGFNGGAVVALYRSVALGDVIVESASSGAGGLHTSSLSIANALATPSTQHYIRINRLSVADKAALAATGYSSLWCDLHADVHVQLRPDADSLPLNSPPHVRGIRGCLPLQLKGSFIRNGPGVSNVYGTALKHPIDGDGVVVALAFDGLGGALLTSAFVETRTRKEEQLQKKMIFKGRMGSVPPAAGRGWRDPAHTNVMEWPGGRLLALHEYATSCRVLYQ